MWAAIGLFGAVSYVWWVYNFEVLTLRESELSSGTEEKQVLGDPGTEKERIQRLKEKIGQIQDHNREVAGEKLELQEGKEGLLWFVNDARFRWLLSVYFNGAYILAFVSWFQTMFTDPGPLPGVESLSNDDLKYLTKCRHCRGSKPMRTHHCRYCERCHLKMDHHCLWLVGCVGFRNQKVYFLFLTYTIICAGTIILTTPLILYKCPLPSFIFSWDFVSHWANIRAHLLIALFYIECLIIFTGCALLWAHHWRYITMNLTTIELLDYVSKVEAGLIPAPTTFQPNLSPFSLGSERANFEQVFGHSPWLWWLPFFSTPGTGHSFPVSSPTSPLLNKNRKRCV